MDALMKHLVRQMLPGDGITEDYRRGTLVEIIQAYSYAKWLCAVRQVLLKLKR
jgi:hypothetical protein